LYMLSIYIASTVLKLEPIGFLRETQGNAVG